MAKVNNKGLNKAKANKKDEFYTRLVDIENELSNYTDKFKDKIVYCNCDDPYRSNFVKYFALNFKFLGLKQLIATCYKEDERSFKWMYNGEQIEDQNMPDLNKAIVINLKGDGDFRSEECLDILKECDIVVTNPPFSLFREFVDTIFKYDKQFLIIGNRLAIQYKEIFPLIKETKMWLGVNTNKSLFFEVPYDYYLSESSKEQEETKLVKVPAISWFTNLDHNKRNQEIILFKKYNKEEYPKYDNCDAIHVKTVKSIPCDYTGLMGVPITIMNTFNPKQFEIVKFRKGDDGRDLLLNGKYPYTRILVKNKKPIV